MQIELNLLEGRQLLVLAGSYGLVGKDEAMKGEWWVERVTRDQDVASLWRKLKGHSRRVERGWDFGPEGAGLDWSVRVELGDQERDGVYWLLLAALDPRTPLKQPVAVLEDMVWPMVRKIGAEGPLRRELKIVDRRSSRIAYDPVSDGNGHAAHSVRAGSSV
jgi:hypothetical protein